MNAKIYGWLPSFGFFIFLALQFLVFWEANTLFLDPATSRHLATGNYIFQTGHIPTVNPFGFSAPPLPWVDFEWAFEVLVAFLHQIGGLGLEAVYLNALFAVIFLSVYRSLVRAGLSFPVTIAMLGFTFSVLHMHYHMRPVVFTYLFLAVVVEVWRARAVPNGWDWIFLPLIFAFWANLHAGWLAGLAFLGISWIGRLLDRWQDRVTGEAVPLRPWFYLGLLCAAATLLNPQGVHLLPHVVQLMGYKSAVLWNEYNVPNFALLTPLAVVLLMIFALLLGARLVRLASPWTFEVAGPILFFIYSSLKTQRHTLLLVLVGLIPFARDLELMVMGWLRSQKFLPHLGTRLDEIQAFQRQAGADGWLAFLVIPVVAMVWLMSPMSQQLDPTDQFLQPQSVAYLRQHAGEIKAPLTTSGTGGPLMLLLWPDIKISFDDRGDLYGDSRVFAFNRILNVQPGWREDWAKGGYDSAIIEPFYPLADELAHDPAWQEGYRDQNIVVFTRRAALVPK